MKNEKILINIYTAQGSLKRDPASRMPRPDIANEGSTKAQKGGQVTLVPP